MICAKYHRERPTGREYRFFYGAKGPSETYRDYSKMQKVTTTSYKIAGQAAAWVCERCVTRREVLEIAPAFFLAAVVIATAVNSAQEHNTANVFACSGLALFLIGVGVFYILTGREEFGEKAAISARRASLAAEGHNAFLTTKQMAKMRRDSA